MSCCHLTQELIIEYVRSGMLSAIFELSDGSSGSGDAPKCRTPNCPYVDIGLHPRQGITPTAVAVQSPQKVIPKRVTPQDMDYECARTLPAPQHDPHVALKDKLRGAEKGPTTSSAPEEQTAARGRGRPKGRSRGNKKSRKGTNRKKSKRADKNAHTTEASRKRGRPPAAAAARSRGMLQEGRGRSDPVRAAATSSSRSTWPPPLTAGSNENAQPRAVEPHHLLTAKAVPQGMAKAFPSPIHQNPPQQPPPPLAHAASMVVSPPPQMQVMDVHSQEAGGYFEDVTRVKPESVPLSAHITSLLIKKLAPHDSDS